MVVLPMPGSPRRTKTVPFARLSRRQSKAFCCTGVNWISRFISKFHANTHTSSGRATLALWVDCLDERRKQEKQVILPRVRFQCVSESVKFRWQEYTSFSLK